MCQEGTEVTWLLSPSISTQQFCLTVSSISPAAGLVLTSFPGNPPLSWESFPLHSLVFASLLSLGRIQEGRAVRVPRDGGSWPPDSEFAEGARAGVFVPARSNVDLRCSSFPPCQGRMPSPELQLATQAEFGSTGLLKEEAWCNWTLSGKKRTPYQAC